MLTIIGPISCSSELNIQQDPCPPLIAALTKARSAPSYNHEPTLSDCAVHNIDRMLYLLSRVQT
jgi:hypothetical protein